MGCNNRAPPPHALEDAATAAQRASTPVQPTSNSSLEKNPAAKPSDSGVQTDKASKTQ